MYNFFVYIRTNHILLTFWFKMTKCWSYNDHKIIINFMTFYSCSFLGFFFLIKLLLLSNSLNFNMFWHCHKTNVYCFNWRVLGNSYLSLKKNYKLSFTEKVKPLKHLMFWYAFFFFNPGTIIKKKSLLKSPIYWTSLA